MRLWTDAEVSLYLGDPGPFIEPDGSVALGWERLILADLTLPVPLKYDDTSLHVKTLRVHRRLLPFYQAAFLELYQSNLFPVVGSIDGAYCWRSQRRSAKRSRHCWAMAVDLDALRNPFLTMIPRVDQRVRDVMAANGFAWGGARIWGGDFPWSRRDPMHFEWAGDPKNLSP